MNIIQTYKDSFQGLNRDVLYFALMMLINRLGTLILAFLTLYTTQELGWSKIDAGTATMCFGIGSLAGAWLGGIFADKIGYYKTMAISLFGASVLFFSLQYFTTFYMLCGFLFLASLVADLLRPALYTGITYFTTKETQTRAISLLRMSFNLGVSIGPAVAGVFIVYYGYKVIFIMDAITCLAAFFFLLKFMKNKEAKKPVSEIIKDSNAPSPYSDFPFMLLMASSCLMLISFFQIVFTVPLYLAEVLLFTEKQIGIWYYGVNGMLIFLCEMPLIHYLEKRWNYFSTMQVGILMIGASILFFVFPIPGVVAVTMYILLVSFGEIINFPFIATASLDRAPKDKVGQYMGINSMMFSLALILAPIIGMWILDHYGYNVTFMFMFGICIVAFVGIRIATNYWGSEKFATTPDM